jgi:rod shape-determining protein MreC
MFKYIKEYRLYIALFLFLLIPVIAIDTSTRSPRDYRPWDRAIIALTSPIQTLITWTLDGVSDGIQNYIYLLNTRRDNLALLEQNRELVRTISVLREAEQENRRLRALLDFRESRSIQTLVARVIAKDVSSEYRAIRINRGESDGIRQNMAVITAEGIVGRVLRTTDKTADVVTVLDLLSAVDAIVERSRARGVIEGLTDEVCQLKFALRTDDIEPGDLLITSGLGGVFPKGVPIGTVSKVNRKSYGISQEVEVRPRVDFTRLEEVLVVTGAEEISPLMKKFEELAQAQAAQQAALEAAKSAEVSQKSAAADQPPVQPTAQTPASASPRGAALAPPKPAAAKTEAKFKSEVKRESKPTQAASPTLDGNGNLRKPAPAPSTSSNEPAP